MALVLVSFLLHACLPHLLTPLLVDNNFAFILSFSFINDRSLYAEMHQFVH